METSVAEFTTVRKAHFGAEARTSEGERGAVVEVVVEPSTGAAISIGIRFGMFGRVAYASFEHLTVATEKEVTLDMPRSALETAPPAGARLTIATQVTLDGKRVGRLAHITFDNATRAPLRVVIDRGVSGSVVAAAGALIKADSAALALSSRRDGAGPALTPYYPDSSVRDDVRRAIEKYARMRVDIAGVDIQVVDGVVWLRGYVSSEMNRRLVEDLSSSVVGVAEIHNLLITDSDLAARISHALASDPRTAEERIGVYPTLGRVRLRGSVHTAVAREATAQIAAGHGASEVINELRVDPSATVLPVLAGVTGEKDILAW